MDHISDVLERARQAAARKEQAHRLGDAAAEAAATHELEGIDRECRTIRAREMTVLTGELLVLIGPPGSGKSTLAATAPREARVLSLDAYRATFSPYGEEADQAVTPLAVAALHADLDRYLSKRVPVVVDATNAIAAHRRTLLDIAARHDVVTTALVVLPSLELCQERNAAREAAPGACGYAPRVDPARLTEMHQAITADVPALLQEGWHHVARY